MIWIWVPAGVLMAVAYWFVIVLVGAACERKQYGGNVAARKFWNYEDECIFAGIFWPVFLLGFLIWRALRPFVHGVGPLFRGLYRTARKLGGGQPTPERGA